MNNVDGSEKVVLSVRTNKLKSEVKETLTLDDLGWNGEQGEELQIFMDEAHKEWVWENIDGYIELVEE